MESRSTIIVGAGMAGMNCALKLQEHDLPYTVVSPNIGGRVCYLEEQQMNFGAVFYMQGYRHARKLLTPREAVLPSYLDLECHKKLGRGYGVLSAPVISGAPELVHFMSYLNRTFKPHYERFKERCEHIEMDRAISEDPYIKSLFRLSAAQLIEKERFPRAAEAVASQFVHACTGSRISQLNALDYLNCAMGLVDTATRFAFDAAQMQERLAQGNGAVEIASVESVERIEGGWRVLTDRGSAHEAANLVMAAPADVARTLLAPTIGDHPIRLASELHAYQVRGRIKKDYAAHDLHLFADTIPLINISKREDGDYEVFTCTPLDMGLFFEEFETLHRVDWSHALFTTPSLVLRQDLGDGLYRIGDHNALGMEPAAISGIFAANRILKGKS